MRITKMRITKAKFTPKFTPRELARIVELIYCQPISPDRDYAMEDLDASLEKKARALVRRDLRRRRQGR
jgi:hypothetical protein